MFSNICNSYKTCVALLLLHIFLLTFTSFGTVHGAPFQILKLSHNSFNNRFDDSQTPVFGLFFLQLFFYFFFIFLRIFIYKLFFLLFLHIFSRGAKTKTKQNLHKKTGCLLKKSLCRIDELCYDDKLLGRCVAQSDTELEITPDEILTEIRSSDHEIDADQETLSLLRRELLRLSQLGATWSDLYSQCLLDYILQHSNVPSLEENICREFLNFPVSF